jgi:hypothetical protein
VRSTSTCCAPTRLAAAPRGRLTIRLTAVGGHAGPPHPHRARAPGGARRGAHALAAARGHVRGHRGAGHHTAAPKPPRAASPPRPRPRRHPPRCTQAAQAQGQDLGPLCAEVPAEDGARGSLDLVGLTGTIIAAIQARFPEFKITGEAFADALKLIAATGTCLIAPHQKGERIWRINLEGLGDPTSAQHRRLCRETRGRVRVEEAAANQRSARPDAPAAGEGAPSSQSTPTRRPVTRPTRTTRRRASPRHAHGSRHRCAGCRPIRGAGGARRPRVGGSRCTRRWSSSAG